MLSCCVGECLQGLLRFHPNFFLNELKMQLGEWTGTNVSEPTIWRALRQSGFTLKKVSATCFWGLLITHIHLIAYLGSTGVE
jgi:hypothetical protein